tara:strand:+ start:26 stop:556 length:531 start_codon:yes stop_codon:yes gene_type:complete
MTDAILYYRTPTSTRTNYALPTTAGFPTAQKLTFTFSDNLLEGIDFNYQNNVLDIPVPISTGLRKINKQDNGLKSIILTINGGFKIPHSGGAPALDDDIGRLKTMASMVQVESKHPFGKIGFYSPNAPEFSLDPNATSSTNATFGYTLQNLRIGYMGQKTTRYGFSATLSYGGTFG